MATDDNTIDPNDTGTNMDDVRTDTTGLDDDDLMETDRDTM